jgi:actin-related protein 9
MFPAEKAGEWEATKIRPRPAPTWTNGASNGGHAPPSTHVDMADAQDADASTLKSEAPAVQPLEDSSSSDLTYEDDPTSEEGAVYPLSGGRIENWSCFLALLTHIYETLSPPFHTPVLVVCQPCWSARDHELLTQFFFETFKSPAFCLMDAALACCYAYGVPTATVIDVGYEKCDVTAVSDFVVCDVGRGIAVPGCGGHDMTRRLWHLLEAQGLDESMCEQLKRSPICEILPTGTELPGKGQELLEAANPAAAASTGAMTSGADARDVDGSKLGQAPRGPGIGTEVGEEGGNGDDEENEGILDVASIVAKGNASEYLAKREREKAEKAAARKAAGVEAARPVRLKNSERPRATFSYEEYIPCRDGTMNGTGAAPSRKRKRDIEVGVERFMAASAGSGTSDGILDTIAATIHNTIMAVPEVASRSTLWDNLIILGNGSRVRGKSRKTSPCPP